MSVQHSPSVPANRLLYQYLSDTDFLEVQREGFWRWCITTLSMDLAHFPEFKISRKQNVLETGCPLSGEGRQTPALLGPLGLVIDVSSF
jgi:hypothetical protein